MKRLFSVPGRALVFGLLLTGLPLRVTQAQRLNPAATAFAAPESVTATVPGTRFFVSNIGAKLAPADHDGDGYISEINAQGRVVTARLLPAAGAAPLHAPKGLAVVGNTLYAADIDRIVGFDLTSRRQSTDISFAGVNATFLNDVLAVGDTALLVSDSGQGRVYALTLASGRIRTLPGLAPGANGLAYDAAARTLYVATLGPGFNGQGQLLACAWPATGPEAPFTALPVPPGFFDGLAVLPGGRLLYSDWVSLAASPAVPGRLTLYDPRTRQTTAVPLPAGLTSPADFYLDPRRQQVLIPSTLGNRVVAVPLPRRSH